MDKNLIDELNELIETMLPEVLRKLVNIDVDTSKDRVRIIFEFEFTKGKIRDAVEIRHRRPWE